MIPPDINYHIHPKISRFRNNDYFTVEQFQIENSYLKRVYSGWKRLSIVRPKRKDKSATSVFLVTYEFLFCF
jgi:hypothetical protein